MFNNVHEEREDLRSVATNNDEISPHNGWDENTDACGLNKLRLNVRYRSRTSS